MASEFEEFRQRVLEDESLQVELMAVTELAEFCGAVVAAGERCGFVFAEDEVRGAYRLGRGTWLMREAQ